MTTPGIGLDAIRPRRNIPAQLLHSVEAGPADLASRCKRVRVAGVIAGFREREALLKAAIEQDAKHEANAVSPRFQARLVRSLAGE